MQHMQKNVAGNNACQGREELRVGGHEYPKDLQARFHDLHGVVIIDPRRVSCLTLGSCPLTANIMLDRANCNPRGVLL